MPFHDLGLAIIAMTFIVRIVIFPFTHRSITTQIKMKKIEPHIQKIRDQFKNNQQEIAKKTMELYKEHGVSPFSGCLMLAVQFPVLIALYQVFINDIFAKSDFLYSFISLPSDINALFLGTIALTEASILFAFCAGFSQFIQMRLALPPKKNEAPARKENNIQKQLMSHAQYIFPVVVVFISLRFPSALALYWTTSNIFAILHEGIVRRKAKQYDHTEQTGTSQTNT